MYQCNWASGYPKFFKIFLNIPVKVFPDEISMELGNQVKQTALSRVEYYLLHWELLMKKNTKDKGEFSLTPTVWDATQSSGLQVLSCRQALKGWTSWTSCMQRTAPITENSQFLTINFPLTFVCMCVCYYFHFSEKLLHSI